MTSQRRTVIFDFDGVLADSRRAIVGSIRHALDARGEDSGAYDDLRLQRLIGPPLPAGFSELLGWDGGDPRLAGLIEAYRAHYAQTMHSGTEVVAGMPEVLAELATAHDLAVATSKPRPFAEELLASLGLSSWFEHVSAPELDATAPGKDRLVSEAHAALGGAPAVMVGDRKFDIAGARANGLASIGVLWGFGDRAELEQAGAELLVERPEQLTAAVVYLIGEG